MLIAALLIEFCASHDKWDPWHLCDPICTYIFSLLVMWTTFSVAKDCIKVLMEATPQNL